MDSLNYSKRAEKRATEKTQHKDKAELQAFMASEEEIVAVSARLPVQKRDAYERLADGTGEVHC